MLHKTKNLFAFVCTAFVTLLAASTAQSQTTTVFIDDPDFMSDLSDSIVTERDLSLPVGVSGDSENTGEYRYKFGLIPQRCRFDRGTYSEWRSTSQQLLITAPTSRRPVQLCLQGRVGSSTSRTETYRWRTIGLPVAVIFAPVSPSETSKPTVKWSEVRGEATYDLDVSQNTDCSAPLQSYTGLTGSQQTLSTLSAGTYYACVYSISDRGRRRPAANNPYMWVQEGENLPGGFSITGPSSPSTTNTPVVSWEESINATSYDVVISSDSTCTNVEQSFSDVTELSVAASPLADGAHYACVTAKNAAGSVEADNAAYRWDQMTTPPGAFAIVAPTSPSSDTTPTVQWETASAADSYDVVIATDAACSAEVQSFSGLTPTNATLAELSDGSYFACVTAHNIAGSTPASNNSYEWTQFSSAPGSFTIIGPASPSNTTTPTVSWTASAAAETYDLVIAADPACTSPVQSFANLTGTGQQVGPMADAVYYACVSAKNINGEISAENDGYSWEQVTATPSTFAILSPSGPITTSTPEVTWESATGADSYSVTLATDSECIAVVAQQSGITDTSYTAPTLPEGNYFTCVTSENAAGSTPASNNGLSFIYDVTAPGAFNITAPTGTVTTTDTVVMWEPSEGAVSYDLVVGTNDDCTGSFITVTDLTLNSHSIGGLSTGDFSICVTAYDEVGNATEASNGPFIFDAFFEIVPQIMFVGSAGVAPTTGVEYPPPPSAFEGPGDADWHCNQYAEQAGLIEDWDGLEIIYKAFMSSDTERAIARIGGFRSQIVNTRGELVALSESELYENLTNAVRYDEFGNEVTFGLRAWTGTTADGNISGATCDNWTSFSGTGTIGNPTSTTTSWLSEQAWSCNDFARLYCISP